MIAARVDANQKQIAKELRDCAVAVMMLSTLGKGVPDMLVGWRGVNLLVEIKAPGQERRKSETASTQLKFRDTWPGPCIVATRTEQIIAELHRLATGLVTEGPRP